jgi:hypothetical protein
VSGTTLDDSGTDADSLERRAWQVLGERSGETAQLLGRALRIREQAQGRDHPDIIWTLSLWIEALRLEHSLAAARSAAELGERRLALKRKVLAGVPEELAHAIAETARGGEREVARTVRVGARRASSQSRPVLTIAIRETRDCSVGRRTR